MSQHIKVTCKLFIVILLTGYSSTYAQNLYWTDFDSIKRANLDGSNEVTLISGLADPNSITINASLNKMYWTSGVIPGSILQANIDGTNVVTLINTGLVFPFAIDVDSVNEKLYWANVDTVNANINIQQSNLDGSNLIDLVTGLGPDGIVGIALDVPNGKIYFTNRNEPKNGPKIQRVNTDGTGLVDLVTTGLDKPNDIAVDLTNGKLYWADGGLKKIVRSNLDGTNVIDVVNTVSAPVYLDLDIPNEHIYFNTGDVNDIFIKRVNFDGTGMVNIIATGAEGLTLGPEPPPLTPTLSQWGLAILLLMIMSTGTILIKYRKISHS